MNKDIKATAYINILSEKVAENMRTLEKELTDIEELQVYVRKQINAHVRPISEAKPVPMEIGHVDTEIEKPRKVCFADDKTEDAAGQQEELTGDYETDLNSLMTNLNSLYKGKATGKGKSGAF